MENAETEMENAETEMETNTEGKDESPTKSDDTVEGVPAEGVPHKGTRSFPRFDMSHPMFFRFEDCLRGGEK